MTECTCPSLWTGSRTAHWAACPLAEPEWGPKHPNFIPGYDDMTPEEWFAYLSGATS